MVQSEFSAALNQVCSEKGLSVEAVLATIEQALVSAYRKDYGGNVEEIAAKVDKETGEARVFKGDEDVTPAGFGRIASQTAKQVLIQRLREAEKTAIGDEYVKKVGSTVAGHIYRIEKGNCFVDLGRAQANLPQAEQIPTEDYHINQRIRALVKEIKPTERGPEIVLSRADPKFISVLFSLEVPEITSGVVEIKSIAREPGSRTKIAVSSSDPKIDPVGSCVGQKGVRVQSVIAEVKDERIDIVSYSEDSERFVANALSPAKVNSVDLNKKKKEAKVTVDESQVSLAIGKDGQNVRLAAKLTGWKIDIRSKGTSVLTEDKGIEPSPKTLEEVASTDVPVSTDAESVSKEN
jgi:N utilization substance protein A